jgi:hypothetical protein
VTARDDGAPDARTTTPRRTPLFTAQHAARYERQELIRSYEEREEAQLVVMCDQIFPTSVTLFEELIADADPAKPLHLLLSSPGGDGEVAVRLLRAMRARCSKLSIIVPDMAKSAATVMCLGADEIVMGPASDLGPIDPQFLVRGRLVGAREILRAVASAEQRVQKAPETYPLYGGLLADVTMLLVEQARSAMNRTLDLAREAMACAGRTSDEIDGLAKTIKGPLLKKATYHGAALGSQQVKDLGLPVRDADVASPQWRTIWELWTRYFTLGVWPAGRTSVYEGRLASQLTED